MLVLAGRVTGGDGVLVFSAVPLGGVFLSGCYLGGGAGWVFCVVGDNGNRRA